MGNTVGQGDGDEHDDSSRTFIGQERSSDSHEEHGIFNESFSNSNQTFSRVSYREGELLCPSFFQQLQS